MYTHGDRPSIRCLCDSAQQLALQDELAFLVLLAGLISLVIFPANSLITLFANNVSYNMAACRHITLHGFGLFDVHNAREKEGFAMLAAEVARYDIVEVGKVCLALLAKSIVRAGCMTTGRYGGSALTLQPKILFALRYVLYVRPIFVTLPLSRPNLLNYHDPQCIKVTSTVR